MKKIFVLGMTVLLSFALVGCGSGESVPEKKDGLKAEEPQAGHYFKDGVVETEDLTIVITAHKAIKPGEEGNEYGDKPVIAFWYDVTNKSNKEINPITAWIAVFTAYQDNDPNRVNELNVGVLPDSAFLDTQTETIKEGGTVSNAVAYELDDEITPVLLKAAKGFGGEDLGEQEYPIA